VRLRTLTVVLLLLCAVPMLATAQQTRYISDELQQDMRSGPGNQYRILQMVSAGTRLTVLEEDSGWSRVRLGSSGQEGWVLSRMLMNQPSARSRLEQAERRVAELTALNEKLNAGLNQAQGQVEELEDGLADASDERDRLDSELNQAAQGLDLFDENQELRKQVIDLRREIEDLAHESERLQGRNDQQWFLVGSLVLGAGLLFGLIIPRIRWRRQRSSWGSGGL